MRLRRGARRPARTAALITLLAVGAASCTSNTRAADSGAGIPRLVVGTTSACGSLDPAKTQGCGDDYGGLYLEYLQKYGPNGKLEPELATSVTRPDAVTYVYHLRHGVTFWDGNEMTSADVVNAVNAARTPDSSTAVYFTGVTSVEATDRYTVTIVLKQPDAGFQYSLSYEARIYEKAFQDQHQKTMGNPGVLIEGTGPWKVDSFDPTRGVELSANPHWWGGKVPVQHITIKSFASETSEALAMRSGAIDVAFPQDGRAFGVTSGAKIVTWVAPAVGLFSMNPNVAPWNDVHVRRAVAYALNRADITAAIGGAETATPMSTIIPPAQLTTLGSQSRVDALLRSLPQYPYDVAKAKAELAQSAYPNGFTASTDTIGNYHYSDIDQVIAAQLAKIGITLKVNVVPINQFSAESYNGKLGSLFTIYYAVSPDPSILPSYLLGSASTINAAQYRPPGIDRLLDAGLAAGDADRRLAIYGQILKRVGTDLPYVPLYEPKEFIALSSKYTLPTITTFAGFLSWPVNLKRSDQ